MTPVYAGIDVCKEWLDVYVHAVGEAMAATMVAAGDCLNRELAALVDERVVLEATGKFHRTAHRWLHAAGFAVAVVNPLRARLFAKACGCLTRPTGSMSGCSR